jgi:hypothetical protein
MFERRRRYCSIHVSHMVVGVGLASEVSPEFDVEI